MKKVLPFFLAATLLLVGGCSNSSNKNSVNDSSSNSTASSEGTSVTSSVVKKSLDFKVIAPIGAPAISMASYYNEIGKNLIISDNPVNVKGALTSGTDEYAAVIFDTLQGYKLSKANGEAFHYKLARTLTVGNLYLVALDGNVDKELTESDKILSFTEAGTPGTVTKYVYSDFKGSLSFAGNVTAAYTAAVAKKFNGEDINYVVLAEPYVQKLLATNKDAKIKDNLQSLYTSKSGLECYPQAGLFINSNIYETKKDSIDSFLEEIDVTMDHVGQGQLDYITDNMNLLGTDDDQNSKVGSNLSTLSLCQKENNNLLGYYYGENFKFDDYYKLINLPAPADSYYLY